MKAKDIKDVRLVTEDELYEMMVEAEKEVLKILDLLTVKKVLAEMSEGKNALDCFHIAKKFQQEVIDKTTAQAKNEMFKEKIDDIWNGVKEAIDDTKHTDGNSYS